MPLLLLMATDEECRCESPWFPVVFGQIRWVCRTIRSVSRRIRCGGAVELNLTRRSLPSLTRAGADGARRGCRPAAMYSARQPRTALAHNAIGITAAAKVGRSDMAGSMGTLSFYPVIRFRTGHFGCRSLVGCASERLCRLDPVSVVRRRVFRSSGGFHRISRVASRGRRVRAHKLSVRWLTQTR